MNERSRPLGSNVEILPSRAAAERNPGMALDLGWIEELHVDRSAAERRAATILVRRSVKKSWQAAWLLKAVSCIDLTALNGDDTPGRIRRLCDKARNPVRADVLAALSAEELGITVGAVCVYHEMIGYAVEALGDSGIPVAAVSTGFPAGLSAYETRLREIEASVAAGAHEIDIVISRRHVLGGNWQALHDEVCAFREVCGEAHMKTIIATGELGTLTNVARASMVCLMAGADFIKTSTGMEGVNATMPVSLVMARMIRDYGAQMDCRVGFKPAGGIRTAKQVLGYQMLMKEELGRPWLEPNLLRFGASSLLADIERQLEHQASSRYAAGHRQPMG